MELPCSAGGVHERSAADGDFPLGAPAEGHGVVQDLCDDGDLVVPERLDVCVAADHGQRAVRCHV